VEVWLLEVYNWHVGSAGYVKARPIRAKSRPQDPRNAKRNCAVRSCPILCLQRQVPKLASGLLYSWSLLSDNTKAINLQIFTSSYGIVGVISHVTGAPTQGRRQWCPLPSHSKYVPISCLVLLHTANIVF